MPLPAQFRQPLGRRLLRALIWLIGIGFLVGNSIVWRQAYAMTNFAPQGTPLRDFTTASFARKVWTALVGVQLPRPENQFTPADLNLAFETHQIKLADGEHLEAWFVPHPAPRGIVVLFHGYAGAKDSLLVPAATFAQFGYSSFLIDFRGSGGSSGANTTLGLREATDVVASIAYAKQQWPDQPLLLYGLSMGGAAILRAVAVEGQQPTAIIIEGVFDRFTSTIEHRFAAVGLPAWPAAPLLVFWGSVQMGYNGFDHNPASYARSVACPILVMRGERDPWVSQSETRALTAEISAPKRIVEFPDIAHDLPYVTTSPELWETEVGAFLASLE